MRPRSAWGRRRLLAVAATALAAATAPGAAGALTLTYSVETRGDVEADLGEFASIASSILSGDGGWSLGGAITFRQVSADGSFRLILASPSEVDAAHAVCSPSFSCRIGEQVLINDVNWRNATAAWTGSLAGYRTYLINHEVGHWLGLGHVSCPSPGGLAPVMQQQSISLQDCRPNDEPLDFERERAASIWNVSVGDARPWPIPVPSWFWVWARWYLGRDEFSDEPFRSAETRPAAAPTHIPDWAWRRLDPIIGEGAGTRGRPWPVPIPAWFWEWAEWYLGRAEYRDAQRDPAVRPRGAPVPIPDWAWVRLRVLLGQDLEVE